jgi:hypothetical protein
MMIKEDNNESDLNLNSLYPMINTQLNVNVEVEAETSPLMHSIQHMYIPGCHSQENRRYERIRFLGRRNI